MEMRYTLGSGFFGGQPEREFSVIWSNNLMKYCSTIPEKIVILANGGSEPFKRLFGGDGWPHEEIVHLKGNLSHVGDLLSGNKSHWMCGWSVALLWGAMTAYANETHFLFYEQDVLAFGDWFSRLQEDLGDGQWIFGHKHPSEPYMWCSNSIVYICHQWIPTFISEYCKLGPEGDHDLVPETKFRRIEMLYPNETRRLSFGVDRCRPIPWDNLPFYAQKISPDEMQELDRRGML